MTRSERDGIHGTYAYHMHTHNRLDDVILQVNDIDAEKLDAPQMAALLDTAPSTRNPVVFKIVRNGARRTVAIPVKKVEHNKIEEKFSFRKKGSITLEAETGFVTTPTLSHSQTPVGTNSQGQQEGGHETPRSHDSAGGSTSGDGDRRWSVIHEGFSELNLSLVRDVCCMAP